MKNIGKNDFNKELWTAKQVALDNHKRGYKMTRKEYMEAVTLDTEENIELYRKYYSQYVTDEIRETVRASNIALDHKVREWDNLGLLNRYIFRGVDTKMRLNGDWLTQAGIVCILKEAKRQLMEAIR